MKGNSYHWRKLHSLLGVIPLGGFILVHALFYIFHHILGTENVQNPFELATQDLAYETQQNQCTST
jgi:hypothetical protein